MLVFDSGRSSKIGDLGRSSIRGVAAPHETATVAGAKWYVPPELLYGSPPTDWATRRFGCDCYLLGSMVVFFFTGLSATALLMMKHLPPSLHYLTWRGDYSDVLPHLQQAFAEMMQYLEPEIPSAVRGELARAVRDLCDPDSTRREHPAERRYRKTNQFSLERYVSLFNVVARRAEILMLQG